MKIYYDMPAEEYHATDAISSSGLKALKRSPAHYWYEKNNRKDTEAFKFGRAFHVAALEPELFESSFVLAPDIPKRKKVDKEFWADFNTANKDNIVLNGKELRQAQRMGKALRESRATKYLFDAAGKCEVSVFWEDEKTGAKCRCRFDKILDNGIIVDLKTTTNAHPEAFMRDAFKFSYYTQTAIYTEGYKQAFGEEPQGFIFAAAEKDEPHGVSAFLADDDFLELGKKDFRECLQIYADCKKTGIWGGYSEEILPLGLPAWALKRLNNGGYYE